MARYSRGLNESVRVLTTGEIKPVIDTIIRFSQHRIYWVVLLLLGITLEGIALYYQYALDEWPCVLCIHIRIWVFGFILLAILGVFLGGNNAINRTLHLFNCVVMIGFVERSWQTLGVERGWVFGDCNLDSGLPPWFALDSWFPALFEVQTSCGYTPLILLNISMAEILMVLSVLLLALSLMLSISSFFFSKFSMD